MGVVPADGHGQVQVRQAQPRGAGERLGESRFTDVFEDRREVVPLGVMFHFSGGAVYWAMGAPPPESEEGGER